MKEGFPPIDIKFTARDVYYEAFDEFHTNGSLEAMEEIFATYLNDRLDEYLAIL